MTDQTTTWIGLAEAARRPKAPAYRSLVRWVDKGRDPAGTPIPRKRDAHGRWLIPETWLEGWERARDHAPVVAGQLSQIVRALVQVSQAQWGARFRAACTAVAQTDPHSPEWSALVKEVGAEWERRREHQAMRALDLALAREVRQLAQQPAVMAREPERFVDA